MPRPLTTNRTAVKSRSATVKRSPTERTTLDQPKGPAAKRAVPATTSKALSKAAGARLARAEPAGTGALVADVAQMIEASRQQVAQTANAALTTLHWQIGARVRQDVLRERRAKYGAEIIATLGRQLEARFGRGFAEKSLRRMVQFAEAFPDPEIVAALRRQLSWAHFRALIPLKDPLKREFYAEMCRSEGWSTRALQQKIDGMLYERTALSKRPEKLIRQELAALREGGELTPDFVFQDPYLLDFLGLRDTFSESDLESALLREIERFLLELGSGFAFVERQKRISLDGDDYYVDLLFYHRRLRRLVVIELKIGDFKPVDAGQVELYLRWLDRHDRQSGEEAPMAIILWQEARDRRVSRPRAQWHSCGRVLDRATAARGAAAALSSGPGGRSRSR
jgi:predicted nuclease of restriction endonuclease-like (RecB) superfamily